MSCLCKSAGRICFNDLATTFPDLAKEATGKKVDVDGVSIDRIKGGMVVSGFDAWDSLGFCKQIGLIPKNRVLFTITFSKWSLGFSLFSEFFSKKQHTNQNSISILTT
jgi:hypothetical protein